ncbi:glycosyltransferase family 2 protein [Thermanaerothrix daxensis]|uniref:glycosyltransferase family 2 protein n=1 Tax=Thermanaerothrix daxensis TaxID=869279 RepID=UPI0006C902CA|nr:glycosyltransferase [Thermanaerothrix daxensis]
MNLPLISVIIPAYNHEQYIREAIQSVVVQSYSPIEIIVIDDGSSDSTAEQAERALAEGGRPCRLIRQANSGAHVALNLGISLASGEYVAILNSDDRYHPERLLKVFHKMRQNQSRFAFTQVSHIDEYGRPHPYHSHYLKLLAEIDLFPTVGFALLLNNLTITTGNFIFHRTLVDDVGYFSPFKTCHDWDYVLRVLLIEEPLYVPQELMDYRIHPQNTLKQNAALVEEEGVLVRQAYLREVNGARNPLAPCPRYWGEYWNFFVDHYFLPMCEGSDLSVALQKTKANGLSAPNLQVYQILAGTLERYVLWLERCELWNEDLTYKVNSLTQKVINLEKIVADQKEQLQAPLYFALRRKLLPLYHLLGGEKVGFLTDAKNRIKRLFGLK